MSSTPLRLTVQGDRDADVLHAVETHLIMHDSRFDPNGRRWSRWIARRRLQTAERIAETVLDCWHAEGQSLYLTGAWAREKFEPIVRQRLGGPIATLLLGWVAEIVLKLILDWLFSAAAAIYRVASVSRGTSFRAAG